MKTAFILTGFVLGFSCQGFCFGLDQTLIQMSTQGLESKRTLTLKNDHNENRYVNVEVFERKWNEKTGLEERTPTTDFKVSEKSLVLAPSSEAKLTLDWVGTQNLKSEKAYRLILTEVKNQKKEKWDDINAPLIQYVTSVFVAPENAKDNVKLVKSEVVDKTKVEVTLTNSGTKHKLLSDAGLLIQDAKDKKTLHKFTNLEAFQQIVLMPGQTKKIVIPTETDWKNKKMTVSIINE